MPYYIIFDHTGKLVAHHMCGSYHGGDGWKMIEIVDELLKSAPAIYLGKEPFKKIAPLAAKVASNKALGGAVKQIDSKLSSAPDAETKAELERLMAVVTRYRDRRLAYATVIEGSQPSKVLPELKSLAKTFKGTSLGKEVTDRLAELEKSESLEQAVAIEKGFRKIVRSFERVKEKKRTDELIEKTVEKLERLIAGKEDLPISETVEAYLAELR